MSIKIVRNCLLYFCGITKTLSTYTDTEIQNGYFDQNETTNNSVTQNKSDNMHLQKSTSKIFLGN